MKYLHTSGSNLGELNISNRFTQNSRSTKIQNRQTCTFGLHLDYHKRVNQKFVSVLITWMLRTLSHPNLRDNRLYWILTDVASDCLFGKMYPDLVFQLVISKD